MQAAAASSLFPTWAVHGESLALDLASCTSKLVGSSNYCTPKHPCTVLCASGRKSFRNKRHVQLTPGESIKNLLSSLSRDDGVIISALDYYSRWLELSDWFILFEELGKRDRWLQTLEVFRWVQQQRWYRPDDGFYAKLISILGKKGQLRLAIWLFGEMKKQGCRPDSSVYNSLMTAHVRSNNDKEVALAKAFGYFEQMKTKVRCQPNLVTYNILLRACAHSKKFDKMDELFKEMDRTGITPDIYTFNGILDAYGKAGCFLEMELVLKQMRQAKVKPDFITFNTLIDAYGKGGILVKMEQALQSMAKCKVRPQLSTFNSLINNYGNAGRVKEMELVFENMAAVGIRPSLVTFEVLMKGYGNSGCLAKMRSCFNNMSEVGVKPQLSTLHALMEAYCSQGRVSDAEALLDSASQMGMEPTTLSYLIVFKGYSKQKNHVELQTLLKKMEAAGIQTNENFFLESIEMYTLESQSKDLKSEAASINNDLIEAISLQ